VFAFVADPDNLPRWAPGFASAVRPDGDRWIVTSGETELNDRCRRRIRARHRSTCSPARS